jgi:hypothetical protein
MMAITTSSSINVNPRCRLRGLKELRTIGTPFLKTETKQTLHTIITDHPPTITDRWYFAGDQFKR